MKFSRMLKIFTPYLFLAVLSIFVATLVFNLIFGVALSSVWQPVVFIIAMYVGFVIPINKVNKEKEKGGQNSDKKPRTPAS